MSAIGALIAGIVSVAATAISYGIESSEQEKARDEARKLSKIRRRDLQEQTEEEKGFSEKAFKLKKKQFAFDKDRIRKEQAMSVRQLHEAQREERREAVRGIRSRFGDIPGSTEFIANERNLLRG